MRRECRNDGDAGGTARPPEDCGVTANDLEQVHQCNTHICSSKYLRMRLRAQQCTNVHLSNNQSRLAKLGVLVGLQRHLRRRRDPTWAKVRQRPDLRGHQLGSLLKEWRESDWVRRLRHKPLSRYCFIWCNYNQSPTSNAHEMNNLF